MSNGKSDCYDCSITFDESQYPILKLCSKHGAAPELYFVVRAALRYIPEGTPTFEDAQYAINLADKETE